MGGPNDITRGKDSTCPPIAEQEDGGNPAYVCVRDAGGKVLARMESRHVHGVGVETRRGDIYAGLTQDRSVDKFVPNRLRTSAAFARQAQRMFA